ncbi:hypothetical protein AKI39_19345 [Bordetella sp. H567]|uniref:hypothetical protein n=1 Tax=Bordetella sp. H567 TaxID=1697043 RepID=UPI00081C8D97|nr:hypothetical protein [Bordetella sp. H567]AOB32414.1 hypothetical protein AKI39_19345 [Bordetella sp. H567]
MKIEWLDYAATAAGDGQPSIAADPLQAELFRAALNAPPSGGDGDTDAADESAGGLGSPLAHIAHGVRGGLAGISNDWQQAHAMAADLAQRPVLDGSTIRDVLRLAGTTSRVSVGIDVVSKVAGKVSHTADVMSRG